MRIAKFGATRAMGLVTACVAALSSVAYGQAEPSYYQDPEAPQVPIEPQAPPPPTSPSPDLAPVQPDAWFEGQEPAKAEHKSSVFLDLRLGAQLPVAFGPGTDKTTAGWDVGLGVGLHKLPLTLGADFANSYGWPSYSDRVLNVNGQATPVHQRQQDHIVFFAMLLRVQPEIPQLRLRPWAEGIVGGQWYKTDYRLSFPQSNNVSDASSTHAHTRAMGFGAGLDFLLGDPPGTWTLTFGIRRVYGGPASFSQTVLSSQQQQTTVHERLATDWMIYTAALGGRIDL